MEFRHLLNLSVQNAQDFISEDFDVKNFPGGVRARNSLEKCVVRCPDGRYRAKTSAGDVSRGEERSRGETDVFAGYDRIATVYYISRLPLSQDHPSTPVNCILNQACYKKLPL